MSAHLNARVLPLFVFAAVTVDPASSGEDRQGAAFPLTVVAQRLQDEPKSALLADDRSVIVTTSYGYGRIVWEGTTGRMLRRLKLPTDDGRGGGSGNLTPDGSRLLNGRTLWDTVRGVEFVQFDDGYSDTAEPELGGTVIAALKSDDRSIDIIDSATGVVQRTVTAPTKVESVALSRDGGLMAIEQGDNSTLVWSTATGSLKATLKGTTSYGTVPFSPSGQLIVTRQSGETDVWGLDGSLKWQLTNWVDIEFSPNLSLVVAHDRRRGAVAAADVADAPSGGEKSSAEIHDAVTGDLLATLPPGAGKFVGFAGNSSVVFDAGEENLRLQFFDVRSGKLTEEIKDEKKQIVGDSTPGVVLTRYEDGTLELYDLLARNVIQRLSGPSSGGSAFALSRSGARVASFHQGRIEVLTAADWKLVGRCDGLASSASHIFFSDDEQTIFVPTEEGALQICSVDKSRRENSNITGAEGAVASSSASGRLAFGISENQLRLTDLHGVQDGITFSLGEGRADSITFSADGQRLFVGTGNNRILSWDLGKTPRERKTLRMMVGPITAMALSHDGTRIAAGTISSPTVKVWNVSDGKLLREMTKDLVGSRSWAMTSMQFLPTNSNIVAAGFGKSVRLWEISSGRELVDFPTEDDVRSLAFTTGGRRLVAVDDAGTVHYWDVETQRLLLIRRQFGDGEWIALTPEGFFDSSPNGAKWLNAVKGMKSFAIDQVYDALYRPDLVAEKLAGDPRGLVKEAAAKLDLDKVMRSGAAPKVSIVSPQPGIEASSDSVSVEAAITALGGGIGRIEWRVNGVTLGIEGERGLARIDGKPAEGAAPVAEKSQKVSRTLSIEPGENTIEIVAYNAGNLIASKPAKVTVKLAANASVRPPKLFVLAIGVNDYYDGRMHLTYAVPDAKDIAAGLAKAGEGHYESVEVTTLIDKDVTAARLGEVFAELAKTVRPKDVLLFYAAGHGKTQDGRYYYLPQDFRYQTTWLEPPAADSRHSCARPCPAPRGSGTPARRSTGDRPGRSARCPPSGSGCAGCSRCRAGTAGACPGTPPRVRRRRSGRWWPRSAPGTRTGSACVRPAPG